MGIFYNPPNPNFGAQQPLQNEELTPASGPAPQNPQLRGSRVSEEILGCWAALAIAAAAILPQTSPKLVPQPAAAQNPPPISARGITEALQWWNAPPLAIQLPQASTPQPAATLVPATSLP